MKKLFFFSLICSFLVFSCKKEEGMPLDDDGPFVPIPTDTLILQPAPFSPGDTTNGLVQAIWQDSVLWIASGLARSQGWHPSSPNDFFDIEFTTYETEFGFLRETMYISEIPKSKTGTFKLSKDHWDLGDNLIAATFHTSIDDGDVVEDSYIIDESAIDNELTITESDTMNQTYKGIFTVSFAISTPWGKQNPENPDNFKIKDAAFWVKIHD